MGGVEHSQPPKKKLKQAQLNFCVPSSDKGRNKRKLNEGSPPESGQVFKQPRQDTTKSPKLLDANKENLKLTLASPSVVACVDLTGELDREGIVESGDRLKNTRNPAVNVDGETVLNALEPIITITECDPRPSTEIENEAATSSAESVIKNVEPAVDDSKTGEQKDSNVKQDSTMTSEPAKCEDASVTALGQVESSAATSDSPGRAEGPRTSSVPDGDKPVAESEMKETSANDAEAKGDTSNDSLAADANSSVQISDSDDPCVVDAPANEKLVLTPKAKAKLLEKQARRAQKLQLRKEKEEQIRQKKEEKMKKKLEEQQMKENERKRKIEEKKRKEEAKEDEKRRKEEERKKKEEAKEEEKKKKEEERKRKEEMKEEDRRKKEEAKLAEERKENLVKMAFSKFFIPTKQKTSLPDSSEAENVAEPAENMKFMPFPLKTDMKLAVVVRHSLSQEEKENLTELLNSGVDHPQAELYLQSIKTGKRKPLKSAATWPVSEEQHDVIIVEAEDELNVRKSEEVLKTGKSRRNRAKLLLFYENRRPPYWGTWGKKSTNVTPRRPFGKDNVFDYEVDSDSEWEDEEEGEDIEKEADSDKEQSDDENVGEHGYIIDKTFVPHGYLSDEEAAQGEEDEESDPEDQKVKLNLMKQEFEQDLKSKTQRLKPRLLGLVMVPNDVTEVSRGSLYETIMNYRCVWDEAAGPLDPLAPAPESPTRTPTAPVSKFTRPIVERLVKLVHGSRSTYQSLVAEFRALLEAEKLPRLPKSAIKNKIKEIARKVADNSAKMVWKVNADLCAEYNLPALALPIKSAPPDSSPSPACPSPKTNPLTSFLEKASPQEPRKRVTPTLISSKVTDQAKTGPIPGPSSSPSPARPDPPVRKRIAPITLSKTVSFSFGSAAASSLATANVQGSDALAFPTRADPENSA